MFLLIKCANCFSFSGVCAAFIQSSDLGWRGSKAGLLPGNQRLSSGASPLCCELRLAGWNRPTHQTRFLPQLLCEPGNPTQTHTCNLVFADNQTKLLSFSVLCFFFVLSYRPLTCSSAITAAWPQHPVCTSTSWTARTATRCTKSLSSGRAWWSLLVLKTNSWTACW